MSVTFTIKSYPGSVREISFVGKISSNEDFDGIKEKVEELLALDIRKIIINLEQVSFMNSSGLNLMLNLLTKTRTKGGELVITNVNGTVEKLFEISKLSKVFKIKHSLDEALNELNNLDNE